MIIRLGDYPVKVTSLDPSIKASIDPSQPLIVRVDGQLAQLTLASENTPRIVVRADQTQIIYTGGTGGGAWGEITGTISDQTDLWNILTGTTAATYQNTTFKLDKNVYDNDMYIVCGAIDALSGGTGGGGINPSVYADDMQTLGDDLDTMQGLIDTNTPLAAGAIQGVSGSGGQQQIYYQESNSIAYLKGLTEGTAITLTDGGDNIIINAVVPTPTWGAIVGTLSDQVDLQAALNNKLDFTVYQDDMQTLEDKIGVIFENLSGLGLLDLPEMPTGVAYIPDASGTTISWVNNNTYTGTTNVIQLFLSGSTWVDVGEVASGETSYYITDYSAITATTIYNTRVSVYVTGTSRYYSSNPPLAVDYGVRAIPFPTAGLQGAWTFESDDLTDSSGNGRDLLATDTVSYAVGVAGKGRCVNKAGYSLYSDNSYLANMTRSTNSYSIAGWFYMEGAVQGDGRTSVDQGWEGTAEDGVYAGWRFEGADTIRVPRRESYAEWVNTNSVLGITLAGDTWYHLAQTYDGVNTITYLNNQVLYSDNETNDLGSGSTYWIWSDTYGEFRIDDCYMWDRGLSAEEITQVYNNAQ